MKKVSTLLRISWIITISIVVCTIGIYIYKFGGQEISKSSEQWGQLGEYFGGIVGPVVALINLIVLSYISIAITRIEEERNQFTLQELARPLGQIMCGDYENEIYIKFKNCGMGPLTIKEIIVLENNEEISHNLVTALPQIPQSITWNDFVVDGIDLSIARDQEINIIKICQPDYNYDDFVQYKKDIRFALEKLTLKIKYVDIYGRSMPDAIRVLELFGRTLQNENIMKQI